MSSEWKPVTSVEQVEVGTKLKIIARSPKNDYERITVKKLVKWKDDTEVILNIRENYYFNLNTYLENRPMWGKWVSKVFYK